MRKSRGEMSSLDRAKQFAPFAALKGQDMELAKYHEVVEDKIELAEDEIEQINRILSLLKVGELVEITYYRGNSYEILTGSIDKIYYFEEKLQIKGIQINFIDIYRIKKMGL